MTDTIDDLTTNDLILKRIQQELARMEVSRKNWMKLADELAAEASTLKVENERLQATLKGIAEYCSGDDRPLAAIERLVAIRNTAERAIRAHEQSLNPSRED